MKKGFVFFLLIFALILLPIKVESKELIPSNIRVGLFYESSARSSYRLRSETGFKVGYKINQEPFVFAELYDKEIEILSANSNDFITIKDNFKNIEDALNYARQLSTDGTECFIFFNGNWAVLTKNPNKSSFSKGKLIIINRTSEHANIVLPFENEKTVFFASYNPTESIAVEGRRYRGNLEMIPNQAGNIRVVNELSLEEYLYGVVPKEVTPVWHEEVLKAQAVAARTYVISNLSKWQKYGFDIGANSGDQVYGGFDAEHVRTNQAVDETRGQVILCNGEPIVAFYHSDSGGLTEDCKNVFGSDLPYLQSVADIFDSGSPHSNWEVTFSRDDINKRVQLVTQDIGEILEISIIERTPAGRVKKMLVKGNIGNKVLNNNEIRNIFQLKSNFFDIINGHSDINIYCISENRATKNIPLKTAQVINNEGLITLVSNQVVILSSSQLKTLNPNNGVIGDDYVFKGYGYGHGVGMSQWGAKVMAENGYNYEEILLHYYKNVEIK